MNCTRARWSLARLPVITTNRAPEMRPAASKSIPIRSPKATWSLGAKSNCRATPQRRTSTLAVSSRPSGTPECGMLGRPNCRSNTCACIASSCLSTPCSSWPKDSPKARKALASCPLALACPTALALALRSARSRSASICTALRCSSRAAKAATSSTNPRRARAAATPGKSLRSNLGSSKMKSLIYCGPKLRDDKDTKQRGYPADVTFPRKRRYCRRTHRHTAPVLRPTGTPYLPVTLAPGVQSLADLDLQPTRRRHVVAPIGHIVGEVALARGVAAGLVVRIPVALAVADVLHQAGRRVAQMQGA